MMTLIIQHNSIQHSNKNATLSIMAARITTFSMMTNSLTIFSTTAIVITFSIGIKIPHSA
jgi:hypothetical protein